MIGEESELLDQATLICAHCGSNQRSIAVGRVQSFGDAGSPLVKFQAGASTDHSDSYEQMLFERSAERELSGDTDFE